MGKIYYLMGKSSSGKDTLYKELKKRFPGLRQVILYTTRPIREGEQDGVEYHFVPAEKLESYRKMKEYFGADALIPIYIEVEDGERLCRALKRERQQAVPRYDELCRRFLADKEDFSEEKLQEAGITRRYRNQDQVQCLEEIAEEIRYGKF